MPLPIKLTKIVYVNDRTTAPHYEARFKREPAPRTLVLALRQACDKHDLAYEGHIVRSPLDGCWLVKVWPLCDGASGAGIVNITRRLPVARPLSKKGR